MEACVDQDLILASFCSPSHTQTHSLFKQSFHAELHSHLIHDLIITMVGVPLCSSLHCPPLL